MSKVQKYDNAVRVIKEAILRSQYDAARSVNEKQLTLYFGIGKYISLNSRKGFWGKGAIDSISEQLQRELPGLRGFSARSLRYMRTFYEEWAILDATTKPKDLPVQQAGQPVLADTSAKFDGGGNFALTSAKLELASSDLPDDSNLAIAIAKRCRFSGRCIFECGIYKAHSGVGED